MSESTDLVRENLQRLLDEDGRSHTEIAEAAWPDRSSDAGRKLITRSLDAGWLRADVADGLKSALDLEYLAEFYLPIDPKVSALGVRRGAVKAATAALDAAVERFELRVAAFLDSTRD